jgi:RNA polymerase sigma factor (TIGR02999 family)
VPESPDMMHPPESPAASAAANTTAVREALQIRGQDGVDRLIPAVYDEMRRVAARHLRRARWGDAADHSLVTTALVNEAYLRLVDQTHAEWNDRAHFMALAAIAMRHVLIDRARSRNAQKRGSGREHVTFEGDAIGYDDAPARLLEINDAIDRLADMDSRLARVVEYRFFGGLSEEESAAALSVTVRTVQRDWKKARALLRRMLEE